MKIQITGSGIGRRVGRVGFSALLMTVLSACVNYSNIHSDKQVAQPQQFETAKSLPEENGHWPAANWADQFGDPQLRTLIDEALAGNPSLAQAQARLAKAQSYIETSRSNLYPKANASYAWTREIFSGNGLYPPPYGGNWYSENNALASASWDLDLWGKNRQKLGSAVSEEKADEADLQQTRVTLTTSVARTYNQLALLYALHDIAQQEVDRREAIDRITASRIATGLDTQVERKTAQANLATARSSVAKLDGNIQTTRYQLAALLGEGPDRGLAIARPTLGTGDEVRLPDNLPADLVSRRPDIVAARWRVEAATHDVKEAKAEFYPDVNIAAAAGLDAFGWGRFLTASSKQLQFGPAVHLPIFDAGALRAQLKGRYADFDDAVATYNQTLIGALSEVATQLAQIRSSDTQLVDAQAAQQAAHQADDLAITQYKGGLTNQLTVLNADTNALESDQAVANLLMGRRDQQIALASALGGGYVDTTSDSPKHADSTAPSNTVAAAR